MDVREKVVAACRILEAEGHEHLDLGHVSGRDDSDPSLYWMKVAGPGLGDVTPADVVLVDGDGHAADAAVSLHQEWPIHAAIYRSRPDVRGVVHTHALHAAAFSAGTAGFRILGQDGLLFADGLGFHDSARLIVTIEQGREVAAALGDRRLVVLRNHGIAAVGRSVEEAVFVAVSFERSLRLQAVAAAFGPVRDITPAEVAAMADALTRSLERRSAAVFEHLLRRADARHLRRPAS